jgi:hypothetical protein
VGTAIAWSWSDCCPEFLAQLSVIFVFLATLCLISWAAIADAVRKTKSLQWPNYVLCGQIMVEMAAAAAINTLLGEE